MWEFHGFEHFRRGYAGLPMASPFLQWACCESTPSSYDALGLFYTLRYTKFLIDARETQGMLTEFWSGTR
jgi:hypothetical protein